jgi:hypothetical protein
VSRKQRIENWEITMTHIRYWAMPLLLATASACGAAPDEIEGAPVAPGSFDDIAERENTEHFNHWAPASAGGMDQVIGANTFYANCADWTVHDMYPIDAKDLGPHEYRTKNATNSYWGRSIAPFAGTSHDACDGYGGANCTVAARMNMLVANKSYWNTNDIWARVLGWNGRVYANTMTRSRPAGKCTGAFVLSFAPDSAYARGGYFFQAGHDFSSADSRTPLPVTHQAACVSTHVDSVLWNAMDVYVRECRKVAPFDCPSRLAFSVSKIGGTWNSGSGTCDSSTASVLYTPPANFSAVRFNLVVSSGVGHVPAAAKISVYRPWL